MLKHASWLVLAAALLIVPTLAQDATQEPTAEATPDMILLPDTITFKPETPGLMPEGVVWDAEHERFLVGSLLLGTIYSVTPHEDGTADIEPFIQDKDLRSTVGLEVDAENNRLLVTNSASDAFMGGPGAAGLAAYDLDTGERAYLVDFTPLYESKSNFANDVTVDDEGNAYVTNSFAPVLYKVTPEGEASVLIEDPLLGAQFLGGNGIVYDDGVLLVANSGTTSLLRVTLGDTVEVAPVDLDIPFGADGMILGEDGTLYGVQRGSDDKQTVVAAVSDDDWATGTVTTVVETTDAATTITMVGETPYYINAYLNGFAQQEYQIVAAKADAP